MLKINIKTGGAAYSDDDVLTTEGRYELQKIFKVLENRLLMVGVTV